LPLSGTVSTWQGLFFIDLASQSGTVMDMEDAGDTIWLVTKIDGSKFFMAGRASIPPWQPGDATATLYSTNDKAYRAGIGVTIHRLGPDWEIKGANGKAIGAPPVNANFERMRDAWLDFFNDPSRDQRTSDARRRMGESFERLRLRLIETHDAEEYSPMQQEVPQAPAKQERHPLGACSECGGPRTHTLTEQCAPCVDRLSRRPVASSGTGPCTRDYEGNGALTGFKAYPAVPSHVIAAKERAEAAEAGAATFGWRLGPLGNHGRRK